jgi:hypothetical protein
MTRVSVRTLALLTSVPVLAACASPRESDSEPLRPAPAFVMEWDETDCPRGSNGTVCFRAVVQNQGDMAGDGYCEVRGHSDGRGETYALSQTLHFSDVAPGESLKRLVVWKEEPEEQYYAYCVPGPLA